MKHKNSTTNIVLKIVFCFFLFSFQMNAQNYILNNGNRRIGNGAESSINTSGNMQQPFYYNGSSWQKLTYSALPLDIKWGVGGDGTSSWNINGSSIENQVLSSVGYDYSGFTTATVARSEAGGTGVIKVFGNLTIGGQLFLIENSYTLGMTDGFIRVKTKITNKSVSNATNVRLWVGTRDDYVGGTDRPTSERGNLVNGVFTLITNVTTQAKAVKVSTPAEAIMMFSNSPRAQTAISAYDGTFSVTGVNPASSAINATRDGQYVVYARFNDLLPNQSDELDWYFAAGTLAEIAEIIRLVAEASSSVTNITATTADYSYSATQSGTTSYILVPAGATVPTAAQVEARVNYTGATIINSSSIATTASQSNTFNFTGLSANTAYTVYAVTKYNNGTSLVFTPVQTTNFTTINSPLSITNFSNINKMYFDGTHTIVAPTSNSTGAFSYTSSNTAVATISGTTITIIGPGTSTITANQAAATSYAAGSVTATLTVTDVEVLTKNGKKSKNNTNYINVNGKLGGNRGINTFGQIKTTKSN